MSNLKETFISHSHGAEISEKQTQAVIQWMSELQCKLNSHLTACMLLNEVIDLEESTGTATKTNSYNGSVWSTVPQFSVFLGALVASWMKKH